MAGELIHTEEEASKILCPQFKTGCRGSGCMWWRWKREQVLEYAERDAPPDGGGWLPEVYYPDRGQTLWGRYVFNRGYCGIAGQP